VLAVFHIAREWLALRPIDGDEIAFLPWEIWVVPLHGELTTVQLVDTWPNIGEIVLGADFWVVLQVVGDMLV